MKQKFLVWKNLRRAKIWAVTATTCMHEHETKRGARVGARALTLVKTIQYTQAGRSAVSLRAA